MPRPAVRPARPADVSKGRGAPGDGLRDNYFEPDDVPAGGLPHVRAAPLRQAGRQTDGQAADAREDEGV